MNRATLFTKENFFKTDGDAATILIRLAVASIFFLEGTHKLFSPDQIDRFAKIGFPNPAFTTMFVGVFETICGILVLVGFATRLAAIPLTIIMITAIVSTKIPQFGSKPVYEILNASRLDFALLLAGIFLFLKGSGKYSIDEAKLRKT